MIALGPKDVAKAVGAALIAMGLLHIVQQAVAGYVQCKALGCLPW